MKNRKWLALGLVACMTMSALSACGQAETKKEESSESKKESSSVQESKSEEASSEVVEDTGITFPLKETMTFTGFTNIGSGQSSITEIAAWQDFEEYGNIHVDWTDATFAEAEEKANLLLAGGTYPDFFYRMAPNIQKYGVEEGIYIPLEDLIRENMPNLTAILDETNGWNDLKSSDGNIYSFGIVLDSPVPNWPFWINKEWLERLGLDMPTKVEDLYEISKAFKEQDANGNGDPNDEIPVAFSANVYTLNNFLHYVDDGIMDQYDYTYIKDGVKSFYPFTDEFKENYIRWWKRMWDEELMDHNSFTQTMDQMLAVTMSGEKIGWFIGHNPAAYANPETRDKYVTIMPEDNENPVTVISRVRNGGLVITDKCENPEVLLAWIDYFYSEEGGYLAYYGREGEHYTKNENGSVSMVKQPEDAPTAALNSGAGMTWLEPSAVNIPAPERVGKYEGNMITGRNTLAKDYGITLPSVTYTEEEVETLSALKPDLYGYIDTYVAEVITGIKDLDDTWDEFQSTMRAMGAEEVEAIYRDAFARASE